MADANKDEGFVRLLLRGVLGGALGGFLWVATPIIANIGTSGVSWAWLFMAYLLVGLPYGAFMGGVVGVSIWLIHHFTRAQLGPFARIVIGTVAGMLWWGLFFWRQDSSGYVESSWQRNLIGVFLLGAATGGLSGLVVGRQTVRQIQADVKTN